jgi:chemotaxis response regulator CheB
MGRDGAIGLKSMLDRGAITIGQDEATSSVWGMPAAAAQIGAVQHQLALPQVAPMVIELVRGTIGRR